MIALPFDFGTTSRADLQAPGFAFGPTFNKHYTATTLPPGWKIVARDRDNRILQDEQGRVRALIIESPSHPFTAFHHRFHIYLQLTRIQTNPQVIIKDQPYTLLETDISQAEPDLGSDFTAWQAWHAERELRYAAALHWLTTHYPNHHSPFAYWD